VDLWIYKLCVGLYTRKKLLLLCCNQLKHEILTWKFELYSNKSTNFIFTRKSNWKSAMYFLAVTHWIACMLPGHGPFWMDPKPGWYRLNRALSYHENQNMSEWMLCTPLIQVVSMVSIDEIRVLEFYYRLQTLF